MTDINELMKAAQQMQEQMKTAQEEMANTEHLGESGAGLVKVRMTGRHDVRSVEISQSLMTEDKAILEDLIAAAINDVVRKVEEKNRNAMGGLAGGIPGDFKMPEGFKFPF